MFQLHAQSICALMHISPSGRYACTSNLLYELLRNINICVINAQSLEANAASAFFFVSRMCGFVSDDLAWSAPQWLSFTWPLLSPACIFISLWGPFKYSMFKHFSHYICLISVVQCVILNVHDLTGGLQECHIFHFSCFTLLRKKSRAK